MHIISYMYTNGVGEPKNESTSSWKIDYRAASWPHRPATVCLAPTTDHAERSQLGSHGSYMNACMCGLKRGTIGRRGRERLALYCRGAHDDGTRCSACWSIRLREHLCFKPVASPATLNFFIIDVTFFCTWLPNLSDLRFQKDISKPFN